MVRTVSDSSGTYTALMFVCPGCASMHDNTGMHILPVNSPGHEPQWTWDGNLEAPTISPSILTGRGSPNICHSFLKAGVFEYLDDCTHSMAGQHVPMPDLPEWAID